MKRALAPAASLAFVLCAACGASASRSAAALRVDPPAQAPAVAPASTSADGALDIGDAYFPGLGNGGYDVEHYDLELDLDMDSDTISATAGVRARATQALASFSLDLYGLEVESVRVDGAEAKFERPPPSGEKDRRGKPFKSSELVVRPAHALAAGSTFTTVVRYSGSPEVRPDPSVGFLPGVGWDRKESGVYVVSECIGASSWYPCNDHPRDKATYSIRVTVAKPYTVAANGILKEVKEDGDARTFAFEARDPMASYLVTLDVAEFGVIEATGPRGMPVRTYHPTDASEKELAAFRRQPEVLAFLESVFGPYPFECAGAVLSYETIGGALECQTIPVYGRETGSESAGEGALVVIVHELAHQWFGDTVSPELWRDIWLNEGFATYAEWLWAEHERGKDGYEQGAKDAYVHLRQSKTRSPFDPGVARVFSTRVYMRGGMVLYGLRAEVGDEVFFRILKEWVTTHANGNASTADFVAHCSKTAGRDLKPFFDAWLYSEITPEIQAFGPVEPAPERPRRGDGEKPPAGAGDKPPGGG